MSTQIAISERELQAAVIELAETLDWLVYHTHDSRRSQPGFPDLVLVKPPRLIFAELKVGKNTLSADQQKWLTALGDCAKATGLPIGSHGRPEGYLWTDVEWRSGAVEKCLRGGE